MLKADDQTADLLVRVYGSHLIIAREEPFGPDGELERHDRVRLTRIHSNLFGLSVRRANGRWERTPFLGSLEEMVDLIKGAMQHLIAPWS